MANPLPINVDPRVSPDSPADRQPTIGLIGMGAMGKMYADRLDEAGWKKWVSLSLSLFRVFPQLVVANGDLGYIGFTYVTYRRNTALYNGFTLVRYSPSSRY